MAEVLTSLERLREIALDQHGLVTSAQTRAQGVSTPLLSAMVRRGRIEHVARGLYRVGQVPVTQYAHLMEAVLWTSFPETCLSHDSALEAWDISDINPDKVHVTVGAHRRIERAIPDRYVIHKEDLPPDQVTWWQSIPTVTPAMAIRQCLRTGVPTYLIRQALERSATTGIVRTVDREALTLLMEERYASNREGETRGMCQDSGYNSASKDWQRSAHMLRADGRSVRAGAGGLDDGVSVGLCPVSGKM